jgi:uncharacterized protein YkwD
MFGLNYVDILIILGLVVYTASQARLGFFMLTKKLMAFLGAIVIAFQGYEIVSGLLVEQFGLLPGMSDALGFIALFILFQALFNLMIQEFFRFIPDVMLRSKWNKIIGIAPAFVDSLIIISLIVFVLIIIPAFPQVKKDISDSEIGSVLVEKVSSIEYYLIEVFGGVGQESLTFLTVLPGADETIELPYQATDLSVDEEAERQMLALLNVERAREGVGPLVMDETVVPVARAHSRDMWERSYFSHTNPDGEDPFARMREGGVRFVYAGENLALARTVVQAHQGLMNSPGHRRNILDSGFTRVGIGVINGGVYGKMFTQNFAR